MGPDVPDLRSATADRSEGSWQGVLLRVVLVRLLHGEGPHTAAASASEGRRRQGASHD